MLSKRDTYQLQTGNADWEFKKLAAKTGMSEKATVELWKWYALLQAKDEL
jgi:hypothetical protein